MIDLRSDTVTRPTSEMRAVMAAAEVGDDVYDDDPTVHRLQNQVAKLLGTEAALFVPSGTMANQICVRVHTSPGDELICEASSHIYVWEAGGPATLSGVTTRTVDGDCGIFDVEQLEGADSTGFGALRANAFGDSGEYAQPGRRPRISIKQDGRNRVVGSRQWTVDALGRGPDLERPYCDGIAAGGIVPTLRQHFRLL